MTEDFSKKINFIIEYFYPEIGGLEKSTERLAIQFHKWGYFVRIITKMVNQMPIYEEYKGLQIVRLGDNYIQEAENLGLLTDACINCVFGVGHNKGGELWNPIFSAGKPSFIKIGTSGDMIGKGIPAVAFSGFEAILCQNLDLITETEKLGISGLKGRRIRNGMDITQWRCNLKEKNDSRECIGLDADSFVISAVGRLVIRKHFPIIIDGFDKFVSNNGIKNSVLIIHGSDFGQHDGEEQYIRELTVNYNSSHSDSKILLITPDHDVSDTLSASDVFVTMGDREGAPNIIIEAMASACPIIATDIPGHQVYVKNNGFLVGLDGAQIADKLCLLYTDRQLMETFSENSLSIAQSFDIVNTAHDYLVIFQEYGLE